MAASSLMLYLSIVLAVSSASKAWVYDDGFYHNYYNNPPPTAGCDDVSSYFPACKDYLNGNEDLPSSTCCSNLEVLNSITRDEGARRICQCIEDLHFTLVEERIGNIYEKCDIHLSFPISQNMDCSSV